MRLYSLRTVCGVAILTMCAPAASAQFVGGGGTNIRERVAGVLRLSSDAPIPVDGDQIAVFFEGTVVSDVFQFTVESAESLEFSVIVFYSSFLTFREWGCGASSEGRSKINQFSHLTLLAKEFISSCVTAWPEAWLLAIRRPACCALTLLACVLSTLGLLILLPLL